MPAAIEIELTVGQHHVLGAAARRQGSLDAFAAEAIAVDRRRGPEPGWERARPTGPGDGPRPGGPVAHAGVLPAATGLALALAAGDELWIEQLTDGQGVDLRALTPSGESFSAAETRAAHGVAPSVGAELLAGPGRPLLTILADTAPGHDLLYPPCSAAAYAADTGLVGHDGCAELAAAVLGALALPAPLPARAIGDDVLNLWLTTAVLPDGRLRWWPARARTGDRVALRAERPVIVALTTCPDDLFGTNQYAPGPVAVTVVGPAAGPTSPWPTQPSPQVGVVHRAAVRLAGADVAHLDALVETGWLGDTRAAVLRAVLLRGLEATPGHGA